MAADVLTTRRSTATLTETFVRRRGVTMTDASAATADLAFDDTVLLDPTVVEGFERDGYAMLEALASPDEAAAMRTVIEPAAIEHAFNRGDGEDGSLDGAFLQSFNLWRVDERIARFVLGRRFAGVAAPQGGGGRGRRYHDHALWQGPRGGRPPRPPAPWYWPLDTDRMITMWMPLVDLPDEVGSMTFAAGSHRDGDLCGVGISRESNQRLREVIDDRGFRTHTHGALHAGDATFHGGWTVHSADRNPTDLLRTVMTVIYFADGARVAEEISPAQDVDRRAWVGGRPLGALADHELNPVLG